MKRKGTIILAMLLVFVIEVCLIYTLKGKMDTLLQFTKCCFANKLRKIFIQSAKKKRRLKGF